MLNNNTNLLSLPKLSFKGLLSAPKGCLKIYDHQSYIQIAGGLLLISKFAFDSPTQQTPTYISYPLHNPQSTILDLTIPSDGKIITLTLNKFNLYQLIIYTEGKPSTLKLETKQTVFVRSYAYDNQICYVFEGTGEESYTQVIWFQCLLKKVKAVGIIPEKAKFCVIDDAKMSLLLKNKIEEYRAENKSLCYEATHSVDDETVGFIELSDRLALYTEEKISISKEDRIIQVIKLENIKQMLAITLGFLVLCEGRVYHYQRRGDLFVEMDVYELDKEYETMEISRKEHLMLVQGGNGLVSIIEVNNNRIDENDHKRSFGRLFLVRSPQQHISLVTISTDTNPYLIVIKQQSSQLIVFSKITLEQILVYTIDCSPIYDCQVQANRPYFLLSAGGLVRRFYVLYDHIQQTIQVNLRARKLVFSETNSYVACLVGSANYSKVQILSEGELKDVAGLWIGQEVKEMIWSDHDVDLYVVLEKGYERYTMLDGFAGKKKREFGKEVVSVGYSKGKGGLVVLLGDMSINIVKDEETISTFKPEESINSLSVNNNILFMTTSKGTLYYNFIGSKYTPSELKLFSGEFQILSCLTNQIICLSKDRTTLFILKTVDKEQEERENMRSIKGGGGESSLEERSGNVLEEKDITFVERSFIKTIMRKEKNHEEKSHQVYEEMQETVREIEKRYERALETQKREFSSQIKDVENSLEEEIANSKNLEREVRENKEKYENEQLKALGELEKLYDRKITLLTNKLMTENEISMRNTLLSKESIEALHVNYKKEIVKINANFEVRVKELEKMDISEKQRNQRLVIEYQQRLLQQHEESQNLVRTLQIQYEQMLSNEKRTVFQWQQKHKKCMVDKINVEEGITKLRQENEEIEKKNRKQEESIEHQRKRILHLNQEIEKLSRHIKDLEVQLDRQRANSYQLNQSNQVLGFKILESREAILPKEKKLEELKEKFCSFETEYQKVLLEVSEQSQLIDQLRKQNTFLKRQLSTLKDLQQKQHRNFTNLLYDIKEIVTETPTEDWNKKISLVYQDITSRGLFPTETQNVRKNKKSMIQEIDRSKNHLELCLKQVITSNNKIQERKSHELLKKLKENADLLQEINELRTKLKKYELGDPLKERMGRFAKRALSHKKDDGEGQRVATQIIQQQQQTNNNNSLLHQNTPRSKYKQSRGFQSTSVDFRRSTTIKKSGEEKVARNTMRKTPIELIKMKRNRPSDNEEVEFLYRKVELQEKIIISLRAKINGVCLE